MEIVIFVAFVTIQYAAKALPNALRKITNKETLVHKCADKVSDNHFLVWLAHPAIWHGAQDYAVHFIVYSGYVIRAH